MMMGVAALLSCGPDEVPSLQAEILSATFEVDPGRPDELVDLEASVRLLATVDPAVVSSTELSAESLPAGQELTFAPRLFGPQGENATVPVGVDETLVVRVIAGSTTNAEVVDLCDRSVRLTVGFATDDRTAQDSFDLTIRCP